MSKFLINTFEDPIDISWKPTGNILDYKGDFVDWINIINKGNRSKIYKYKPFFDYCNQAQEWVNDNSKFDDFKHDKDLAKLFLQREKNRLVSNSLYYLDKYHYIMEGDVNGGYMKYKAYDAQKVLAFLFDSMYNNLYGKARQVFFTTTMCGLITNRINIRDNYKSIYICDVKERAERLFKEKIRWAHNFLPNYLKRESLSRRDNIYLLNNESYTEVLAASETSATGFASNCTFLDEIGLNSNLSSILAEIRPALFMFNPLTKKLEMKRQIVAWGCVCAGTKVWTNNGDFINIEDLKPEQGIIGYDGASASKEEITYWQPPAKKECVRITTKTGRILECSYDHPILWSNARYGITPRAKGRKFIKQSKFIEAINIKVGDQVAIIDSIPFYGEKKMWEPRFIGWLIGDGTYGKEHSPIISNCDLEINNYIEKTFDSKVIRQHVTKNNKLYKEIRIKGICDKLRNLGIYGQTKLNKRLPIDIHSYTKNDICELLGGLFDTDGCVHYTAGHTRISLTSSSYELLNEVRFLLQKIGVHPYIHMVKANIGVGSKDKNNWYDLVISDKTSIYAFNKNINFTVKYKQERLGIIVDKLKNKGVRISKSHIDKNIRFESVKKIEHIGLKDIYNLTAGGSNTYVANGIITHNTGGNMNRGGAAMEMEWNTAKDKFKKGHFEYGIIPIFFDVFWREGMTREIYESEKRAALSKAGIKRDEVITQFYQHYPTTERHMFLRSNKTIIPPERIEEHLYRIRNSDNKPQKGFFKPVYDTNRKIINTNFIPIDDPEAPITIYKHPEKNWVFRYYQGTDPVNSSTGASKMASVIYDAHENKISAYLNHKERNYTYLYEQALQLNMYYGVFKELIEINAGEAYVKFLYDHSHTTSIMGNKALPLPLQSSAILGIHNIGKSNKYIVNELMILLELYHDNIDSEVFYEQLNHFVEKQKENGEVKWATEDKRYYQDDVIFATTFSYIAAMAYNKYTPREVNSETQKHVKSRFIIDTAGQLVRDVKIRKYKR